MTDRLTLRRPDDWHLHLRDGAVLQAVAPGSAGFARALVMPNLVPPVTDGAMAAAYARRIREALPPGSAFQPLMTLYLTEATPPETVLAAHRAGVIAAVKLYPAGATTNSASGVRDVERVIGTLEAMADAGVPLCVHGEVTDPEVDIFDREAAFIDRVLDPLRARLPGLRVVMEHITTAEGAAYARSSPGDLAATITVHHLLISRNEMLAGGIRPHYYCLPIVKRARHRAALIEAATSGEACYFLGTDSAPHLDGAKLAPCGCAGCYTAPVALPYLATVFEAAGALERLEDFTSRFGAEFYGLPLNEGTLTLERAAPEVPASVATAEGPLTVFAAPDPPRWRVVPEAQ